jgi:hypothetical protein
VLIEIINPAPPKRVARPTVAELCTSLATMTASGRLPGRGAAPAGSIVAAPATSGPASHYGASGERKTGQAAPSADLLRMALEELPNHVGGPFDHRDDWLKVALAVKGASVAGGIEAEGREAFILWSEKWGGGDPDEPGRVWDTAKEPFGTGWGAVMRALEVHYPAGAARVHDAITAIGVAQTVALTRAAVYGSPFAPVAPILASQIPPRRWLYGRSAIAGFVSFLVAPGGAGKSALIMVEAVAMASGRELLSGEKPVRPLRVWLHNAEDDAGEMQRRLAAVLMHYGLTYADLNDNLFLTSGRDMELKLASLKRDGPEITPGVVDALVDRLVESKIDVLILDPLGALHTLPENSNEAANLLSGALRQVAHRAQVAVVVLHHAGKAAAMDMDAAGAGASRGASAFVDAARVVRQVVRMTDKEASRFGVADADRRDYLRIENGKANLARAEGGRWLHMVDVPLGNGLGLWPDGDRVGVVERFAPQELQAGSASDLALVHTAIGAAHTPPRYDVRSRDWVGYLVAQALGLKLGPAGAPQKSRTAEEAAAHARVRGLVESWLRDGGLIRQKGRDPKTRHEVDVVGVGRLPSLFGDPVVDAEANALAEADAARRPN